MTPCLSVGICKCEAQCLVEGQNRSDKPLRIKAIGWCRCGIAIKDCMQWLDKPVFTVSTFSIEFWGEILMSEIHELWFAMIGRWYKEKGHYYWLDKKCWYAPECRMSHPIFGLFYQKRKTVGFKSDCLLRNVQIKSWKYLNMKKIWWIKIHPLIHTKSLS